MSIIKLAKKAAKASAGFVWKESGAGRIPILEDGRRIFGRAKSGLKPARETADDAPVPISPAATKGADPAMAEKMAKLRARKAEIAATKPPGQKLRTVDPALESRLDFLRTHFANKAANDANQEAHARALDSSKFDRVPQVGSTPPAVPPAMVTDIRRIKELNEELLSKIGNGFGGVAGGIAGLLGDGLKSIVTRLLAKIGLGGGLGALGGMATGGIRGLVTKGAGLALGAGKSLAAKMPSVAGTISAGAGLFGKVPSIIGGIGTSIANKGASVLEAGRGIASSIPGIAKGAAGAALGAGGTILSAAKAKGASLLESGKGLISKLPGMGAAAGEAAGKIGLKNIIKNVPILGLLARTGFAVKRALDGDWTGAGMEVAAGIASTFPGAGTAGALGIDAALIAKDAGAFDSNDEKKVETGAQNVAGAADKANNAMARVAAGKPEIQRAIMNGGNEPVTSGLASLQAFVIAAMDSEKGIFVRPANSPFDDKSLFKRQGIQPAAFQPSTGAPSTFERAVTGRPQRGQTGDGPLPQLLPKKADAQSLFSQLPTDKLAASPLGNLIARGEGDYNSYNSGTKGVSGGKIGHSGKKDLASMTLNEIIASSEGKDGNDKDRVFAAGRYQIIAPTLKKSMEKMGLKGDEKFTPELQDRIFKETLIPKSVNDYLNGGSTDKEKAQVDLAKVWRSFADPRTGKTYADAGAGANRASITAAESAKALDDTRALMAKNSVKGAESNTSAALEQASSQARAAEKQGNTPIVIQSPQQPRSTVPVTAGGAKSEVLGHMSTRNDDSSIKRLTDQKMSYGMV